MAMRVGRISPKGRGATGFDLHSKSKSRVRHQEIRIGIRGLWIGEYLVQYPDNAPKLGVGGKVLILASQNLAHPGNTGAVQTSAIVKLRLERDGVFAPLVSALGLL
jgi:hypothetical protein